MEILYQDSDQIAARILAAALLIQHPKLHIIEASADTYGFSCRFSLAEPFDEQLFPFIEQTMQSILNRKEFKLSEMVRDNACEFLTFHGHKKKAQELKQWSNGLVFVLEVSSYIDVLDYEIGLDHGLHELKLFKLVELVCLNEEDKEGLFKKQFVLKGIAANSSSLLKNKYKTVKQAQKEYHVKKGEEGAFFSLIRKQGEEIVFFQPEGVKLKQELLGCIKEIFKTKGFEEVGFSGALHESDHLDLVFNLPCFKYLSKCFFEELVSTKIISSERDLGLYSLDFATQLSIVEKSDERNLEEILDKTIKEVLQLFSLLDLEVSAFLRPYHEKEKKAFNVITFFKKSLERCSSLMKVESFFEEDNAKTGECELVFFVKDLFERNWEVARIEIKQKKNPYYVRMDLISVERLIALLFDLCIGSAPRVNFIKKI